MAHIGHFDSKDKKVKMGKPAVPMKVKPIKSDEGSRKPLRHAVKPKSIIRKSGHRG